MNAISLVCAIFLRVSAALLISAAAVAARADPVSGSDKILTVRVNVPPAWLILGDDPMSEVLAQRTGQLLIKSGFAVRLLRPFDEAGNGGYSLTIDLTDWRLDAQGYAHGTLTARLTTPQESYDLGPYSSSTLAWTLDTPPFRLSAAFEEATEGAIEQLVREVTRVKSLAQLRAGKNPHADASAGVR